MVPGIVRRVVLRGWVWLATAAAAAGAMSPSTPAASGQPAPEAGASSVLKIKAAQASIRTVGGPAGGAWNLWSNGRVGEYLRIAKGGQYRIVVVARGSRAGGVWPRMAVLIDGSPASTASVDSEKPAGHTFLVKLAAGVHEVAVAFTNDAVIGKEDRNLYVQTIEIHPPPGAAAPALAPASEVADMAARQEQKLLASLDAEIERHRKGEATVQVVGADGRPVAGAQVEVKQESHDFLFGCNIYRFDRFSRPEHNEAYKKRFAELLNYATVGFYWRSYEPQRGKPRYDYTDRVVAWCRRHDIRMKGHPLLWGHGAGVPVWSKGQPPAAVQKKRVTDIVRRYAGKIRSWEVVNEPSHCRGVRIDQPYRWARQADANAYLIVNDYYVMATGYLPFYQLLKEAKADGVPFDGIGIQAHEPRTMRFPLAKVRGILDKYATLGKELHITEFTPCSAGQRITGSHLKGVWNETTQADYATKFYKTCFAHPAVVAITWWDLCDNGSWLKGGGMLRADMSPKPVYLALKKLIHEQWKTHLRGKTDSGGTYSFRGFRGRYALTARTPAGTVQAKRHLKKGARNQWVIRLRG